MKTTNAEGLSPAMRWLQMLWDNQFVSTRHSWRSLNDGMRRATHVAIRMGLRFDIEDFSYMTMQFGFGHWAGSDNDKNFGEQFYTTAVEAGHLSACQSFEQWRGRKPFFVHGKRLRLNSEMDLAGQRTFVTSFDDEKGTVTLCAYATIGRWRIAGIEEDGPNGKPIKRYTVTLKELRAEYPTKQRATKEHTDHLDDVDEQEPSHASD